MQLDRDKVLALQRAIPGQEQFTSSLYPPLARIIMDAVNAKVLPPTTVLRRGDPPVLILDYSARSISLVAEPTSLRLDICLVESGSGRIVRRWTAFTNPGRTQLVIISAVPGPSNNGDARWVNYTLGSEIVGDLAEPDLPDLISDIVRTLQPPAPQAARPVHRQRPGPSDHERPGPPAADRRRPPAEAPAQAPAQTGGGHRLNWRRWLQPF